MSEPPALRQKCSLWDQRRKSGLERSDIMKWTFIIETSAVMGVKVGIA
jgi:hypothetical protein